MRHFLFAMALTGALGALASPLSPDQALSRLDFMSPTRAARPHLVYQVENNDQPAVYVFNNEGSGFMIVSADDVALPLLGYSDEGSFDPANIPANMKWWLGEYARQISFAVAEGATSFTDTRSNTRADFGNKISPMIKTKWNQGAPYNNQCPEVQGIHCVTGCVATAMAQVMNYHRFPEAGIGEVSVSNPATNGNLKLDLSAEKFDWANMLDNYMPGNYSDEEADAVAYLMKACGYAVGMSYTTSESGASSYNIGSALIENFSYNPYITYEERNYYNETSWGQMVYDELASNRPVIYGGQSEGGGHQFVCDGYDGNGYFHINWGWGGISDGYFLLQSLNPDDLGIGGGTGGGYSFDQSIIKDVQPNSSSNDFVPQLSQDTNIKGNSTSTAVITFSCTGDGGWWNMTYGTLTLNIGVIIENLDNPATDRQYVIASSNNYKLENVELGNLRGFKTLTFTFPTSLPDGKYKATIATQDASVKNAEWVPVKCAECYSNFATITKKGSSYKLEYEAEKTLSVVDCEFLTPLYSGSYAKMNVTVTNDTDVELTQTLAPALMKQGEYWYVGDEFLVNLKPGETITKEITSQFVAQKSSFEIKTATTFTLKVFDYNTSKEIKFSKSVTMEPATSGAITVEDPKVANAIKSEKYGYTQYLVEDATTVDYSAIIKCTEGYYGNQLWIVVADTEGHLLSYQPVAPVVTLSAGEECVVSAELYMGNAVVGEDYQLLLCTLEGNTLYILENGRILLAVGASAVEVLEADAAEVVSETVYNLGGQQVAAGADALNELPGGIYIVKTVFADGSSKTRKIIK